MKVMISAALLFQLIFLATNLHASEKLDQQSLVQPKTSRRDLQYFMDDRSPREIFLLEQIRCKQAQKKASQDSLNLDSVEEQAEDYDREVSVFVTGDEERSDCQSPWCSPRSDSTDTLVNGQKRSGARNPSPQLRLEDLELKESDGKDCKK